jgi:hypothetical protein
VRLVYIWLHHRDIQRQAAPLGRAARAVTPPGNKEHNDLRPEGKGVPESWDSVPVQAVR